MRRRIITIAEGKGELDGLPALLRRVFREYYEVYDVEFPRPFRVDAGRLIMEGGIEKYIELASRQTGCVGILVLMDADDEDKCPARMGPELLRRALTVEKQLPVCVVLAKREFETWFIAGVTGLRGHRSMPVEVTPPEDPESIRGAKEWLSSQLPRGLAYKPTALQASFCERFDLKDAYRLSGSFRKLWRDVGKLAGSLGCSPAAQP